MGVDMFAERFRHRVMDVDDVLADTRKVRLLEWLTTPPSERRPSSQEKLGEELGVTARALRKWKADPRFRAVWEREAKRVVGDPSKVQEVIEEMRLGALDRRESLPARARAAQIYLGAVDGIKPPVADGVAKAAAEMSDDELRALLAQAAAEELSARERVVSRG